jgi:hypothetical protein
MVPAMHGPLQLQPLDYGATAAGQPARLHDARRDRNWPALASTAGAIRRPTIIDRSNSTSPEYAEGGGPLVSGCRWLPVRVGVQAVACSLRGLCPKIASLPHAAAQQGQ